MMNDNELDGYKLFFEKVFPNMSDTDILNELWNFANTSLHKIEYPEAEEAWNDLKQSIDERSKGINKRGNTVYVRTFGNKKDRESEELLRCFYKHVYGIDFIKIDKSNNQKPTSVLQKYTDYSKKNSNKKKKLVNYQISHIFGKTLNCYAFAAPWNVIYLPKILDPLTGHESKGIFTREFTKKLQKMMLENYKDMIVEYNEKMEYTFMDKIKSFKFQKEGLITEFGKDRVEKFFGEIDKNFSKIELPKEKS